MYLNTNYFQGRSVAQHNIVNWTAHNFQLTHSNMCDYKFVTNGSNNKKDLFNWCKLLVFTFAQFQISFLFKLVCRLNSMLDTYKKIKLQLLLCLRALLIWFPMC